MKRIKVLNSYAAHARFLGSCGNGYRWMARKHCPVRTPYSSWPTVAIRTDAEGRLVWVAETAHKRYEVWQVTATLVRAREHEAEEEQFKT